jgi:hypothetical protein
MRFSLFLAKRSFINSALKKYQNDQIKEDEMGGTCSTYVKPEGKPVGRPRKNERMVFKPTLKRNTV